MTKLKKIIISLTLMVGLAVKPVGAQTEQTKQGHEMEGMQHGASPSATPQQEQQRKPPQTGQPQPGQEMPAMPGMEGMQHGEHKMKMEPLPPPVVPKLGMTQSMAKAPLVRLEDLAQMALHGNPTLRQAATDIRSPTGRKLHSALWPNPTAGYIGEEIGRIAAFVPFRDRNSTR